MATIHVQDVMTDKLTVASLHHKFSQVMEFFNVSSLRHLPVTDQDQIIGIISIRDVLHTLYTELAKGGTISMEHMDQAFKVRDIMTATPITVEPGTTVPEALQILINGGFHALPVVENNVFKGLVTYHDMLNVYYKEQNPPAHFSVGSPGFGI
jgi:acetoin utilization protein AcuB